MNYIKTFTVNAETIIKDENTTQIYIIQVLNILFLNFDLKY